MTHFDPEPHTGDLAELAPEESEEGVIRPEFVAEVADAVAAEDQDEVRRLAGELHEADLATLIENLPGERGRNSWNFMGTLLPSSKAEGTGGVTTGVSSLNVPEV